MAIPMPNLYPVPPEEESAIERAFASGLAQGVASYLTEPFARRALRRETAAKKELIGQEHDYRIKELEEQSRLRLREFDQMHDITLQNMYESGELVSAPSELLTTFEREYGFQLPTIGISGIEGRLVHREDLVRYQQALRPTGEMERDLLSRLSELTGTRFPTEGPQAIDTQIEFQSAVQTMDPIIRAMGVAAQTQALASTRLDIALQFMRDNMKESFETIQTSAILDPSTGRYRRPTMDEALAYYMGPLMNQAPHLPGAEYWTGLYEEVQGRGNLVQWRSLDMEETNKYITELIEKPMDQGNMQALNLLSMTAAMASEIDPGATMLRDRDGDVIKDIDEMRQHLLGNRPALLGLHLATSVYSTADEYVNAVRERGDTPQDDNTIAVMQAVWRMKAIQAGENDPRLWDVGQAAAGQTGGLARPGYTSAEELVTAGAGQVATAQFQDAARSGGTIATPPIESQGASAGYLAMRERYQREFFDRMGNEGRDVQGALDYYWQARAVLMERLSTMEAVKDFFRQANSVRASRNLPPLIPDEEIENLTQSEWNTMRVEMLNALEDSKEFVIGRAAGPDWTREPFPVHIP